MPAYPLLTSPTAAVPRLTYRRGTVWRYAIGFS